jgi:predicted DNA-binding protein
MIRSAKKLDQLAAILERKDTLVITEAVKMLRDEQPFEGAVGLLASLYNRTTDKQVRKAVEEFLNDLKDQLAANEIIVEIKKGWNPETMTMLAASCWQSGLDFTEFLPDLAMVFSASDYLTAIECFTVIEESAFHISDERKTGLIEIIKKGTTEASDDKKRLSAELIRVLSI